MRLIFLLLSAILCSPPKLHSPTFTPIGLRAVSGSFPRAHHSSLSRSATKVSGTTVDFHLEIRDSLRSTKRPPLSPPLLMTPGRILLKSLDGSESAKFGPFLEGQPEDGTARRSPRRAQPRELSGEVRSVGDAQAAGSWVKTATATRRSPQPSIVTLVKGSEDSVGRCQFVIEQVNKGTRSSSFRLKPKTRSGRHSAGA